MNARLFLAIMAAMVIGCLQAWGPPVDPDDPDGDGDLGWGEWRAGTDPTNSSPVFEIQMEAVRVHQNTMTAEVDMSFRTQPARHYSLVSAEGMRTNNATGVWSLVGTTQTVSNRVTFTDTWSGGLNTNGRTYAGMVTMNAPSQPGSQIAASGQVMSANAVYLPYPFLSPTGTVLVVDAAASNGLAFHYRVGGAYRVLLGETNVGANSRGFFRLFSADTDPTNATIQSMELR